MSAIGPHLHTLLHRLTATPTDFVAGPAAPGFPAATKTIPEVTAQGSAQSAGVPAGVTPAVTAQGSAQSAGVPAGVTPAVTAALVNDLLTRLGRPLDTTTLKRFCADGANGTDNRLALVRIVVWLLGDETFRQAPMTTEAVLQLLDVSIAELAKEAKAAKYVNDADRREELARLTLARLGLRPQGETEAQATDRLSAISSSERRRLVAASRETERRARAIREALVRKQAEESADKWSRE